MEYTCTYRPDLGIIEAATRGAADLPTMLDMLRSIAALCRQEKSAQILVDHSELDAGEFRFEAVETLAHAVTSLREDLRMRRCAHVVSTDLQLGLVRSWEIMVEMGGFTDIETRVFRNREEAVSWVRTRD